MAEDPFALSQRLLPPHEHRFAVSYESRSPFYQANWRFQRVSSYNTHADRVVVFESRSGLALIEVLDKHALQLEDLRWQRSQLRQKFSQPVSPHGQRLSASFDV